MIDGEGGDADAVGGFEDGLELAVVGHLERVGLESAAGGRHDVGSMVGDSVAGVGRVGLIETGDDLVDDRRSVDGQGMLAAAAGPAPHAELAETVDVIGVGVGEEDGLDSADVDGEASQVARAVGSGVTDIEVGSGLDGQAGSRAPDVDERSAGSGEQDVDSVGPAGQCVASLASGYGAVEEAQGDFLGQERDCSSCQRSKQSGEEASECLGSHGRGRAIGYRTLAGSSGWMVSISADSACWAL